MRNDGIFVAGIGVAYAANESRDRLIELIELDESEEVHIARRDMRLGVLDILGIDFDPARDIDPDPMINKALLQAEVDKCLKLVELAGYLLSDETLPKSLRQAA